jgi:predicted nucleotidyltransferase
LAARGERDAGDRGHHRDVTGRAFGPWGALPIRALSLFGSRTRQDAAPASDLDVLVTFAQPVPLFSFPSLEARLAEITGLRIDLVSAAALKPHIGRRICLAFAQDG